MAANPRLVEQLKKRRGLPLPKSPDAFPGASGNQASGADFATIGPNYGPTAADAPLQDAAPHEAMAGVSPEQVQEAQAALDEHEAQAGAQRPGSVPGMVGQAVMGAAPQGDDEEMYAAQDADRKARNAGRMELAAKQFVAGMTQTPQASLSAAPPSQVPQAMEQAKTRREQVAAELARRRQAGLDEQNAEENKSQAALRNAQIAHLLTEKKAKEGAAGELDSYKKSLLAEYPEKKDLIAGFSSLKEAQDFQNAFEGTRTRASNERVGDKSAYRAEGFRREDKATDKAEKAKEDIPPGFEVPPDAHPGPEARKKFSALVGSSEKMKGLTQRMRAALKGTTGVSRTLDPKTVTSLKQLGTQIQIEAKNVAGLGALSGPDMGLMNAIAADPTSIQANLTTDFPKMLDQLDAWGDSQVDGESRATGIRRKAAGNAATTKTVGGKTYRKVPGGWELVP